MAVLLSLAAGVATVQFNGPLQRSALLRSGLSRASRAGLCAEQPAAAQPSPLFSVQQLAAAQPSQALGPREVIDLVLAALHRDHSDEPSPNFGAEVALRFLAPGHQFFGTSPSTFRQWLGQPHKRSLVSWREYRYDGDLVVVEGRADLPSEAYQQVSVRSDPTSPWETARWLLVQVDSAAGFEAQRQWMVEGVFVAEPDLSCDSLIAEQLTIADAFDWAPTLSASEQRSLFSQVDADGSGAISLDELASITSALGVTALSDSALEELFDEVDADGSGEVDFDEFEALLGKANARGSGRGVAAGAAANAAELAAVLARSARTLEGPRQVVSTVMEALRRMDEPYPFHGAELAMHYCSPTNPASTLSPEGFARYLDEPWYSPLISWDELRFRDEAGEGEAEDEAETEAEGKGEGRVGEGGGGRWASTAEVDVLVREGCGSWSVVAFMLSRHNGRWLIDSLDITA